MLNDGQNGFVTFATGKMVVTMEQELIQRMCGDCIKNIIISQGELCSKLIKPLSFAFHGCDFGL